MVVVAVLAEWFPAAFRPAVIANRGSAVRAVGNSWFSAADSVIFVGEFDLTARASHSPTPHKH
jgi:hypothetical protein